MIPEDLTDAQLIPILRDAFAIASLAPVKACYAERNFQIGTLNAEVASLKQTIRDLKREMRGEPAV